MALQPFGPRKREAFRRDLSYGLPELVPRRLHLCEADILRQEAPYVYSQTVRDS